MQAITRTQYGGPEVLKLSDVDKPSVKPDHLLIKVKANSANPADWHILRGKPAFARVSFGLFKPKNNILGADFAGIVEAVGENVSNFKIGDRVFGEQLKGGAFAEYACIPAKVIGHMPDNIGFQDMAAAPIAGITALQALLTHGQIKTGESVLINGSSGGVGHFAVQVAKAQGAKVTAVCSAKNRDFVLGLGADHVLAYDETDIHKHDGQYDLVLDTNGNLFLSDYKRMGKRGVVVGFTTMGHMMTLMLKSMFSKFPLTQFTAKANTEDLDTLAKFIENKLVNVHIEKTYKYQDIPGAIAYIETMRTRGKVVMIWEED